MAFEIIVAGHLCIDLLPGMSGLPLSKLPSPGKLFEIEGLTMSTGGAVSNTGLALHRLGADVGLLGSVGDDLLGRVIKMFLADRDPRLTEHIAVLDQDTSYTVVLTPKNTDRILLHCPGVNDHFDIGDMDFSAVTGARIFHLGYPPLMRQLYLNDGESLYQIFRTVDDMGVVTSLDTAFPDPGGLSGQVDWVAVMRNFDRWDGHVMPNLTGPYLHDLAGEMLAMGTVIAGFKLGELGFYIRTSDQADKLERLAGLSLDLPAWLNFEAWHPAFAVDVVGTTGAGDSAYAGFLAALLHGLDPQDALRTACAVGACNVEAADSTAGVRSWDTTRARLQTDWAVSALGLPGAPSQG
jgi:sugar/nucleoside kinase (ribokinase family)